MIAFVYGLAVAILTLYGVNLLWMAIRHAELDRLEPGNVPDPAVRPRFEGPWPHVTVQLPLYNEPLVAERLINACAVLDYPRDRLEIQVLDDSTDHTVARVAGRVERWRRGGRDIVHIRRLQRDGFKAGALQNGLQMARGAFIAVFDADFVPPADFLKRMLPEFTGPGVGLVQARWGHMNAEASLLTRLQAIGLDAHFSLEQRVREGSGCFMNFNGTAGIWRRTCIEEAGGWHGDTLAEDLDLSYRAQMLGWSFRYIDDVEVPAELPATMAALRTQQFRWAKGSAETARKLLASLWRSDFPLRVKVQGSVHMTAHFVFLFVLLAAILHAPLLLVRNVTGSPGEEYFALLGLGLAGFTGFCLAQVLAQRRLYPDWLRKLQLLPVFMAGTMGLSLNNSRAVVQALRGKTTAFVRTPKFNLSSTNGFRENGEARPRNRRRRSARERPFFARQDPVIWAECGLLLYCLAGLVAIVAIGDWAAVPFQALFAGGFGLVVLSSFRRSGRISVPKGSM